MRQLITIFVALLPLVLSAQSDLYLTDPISVSPDNSFGYRAPRVAVLGNGAPVVYWGKPGAIPKMYLAVGTNDGFNLPLEIPTNGIEPDLWGSGLGPQLAAHGESIYLVWESYGTGIFLSKSTDAGMTFENPVNVYDFPPGRVATLPSVSADSQGNPIIGFVTTNFQEGEAQYEILISQDGGLSFSDPVIANTPASGEEVCECCPASIAVTTEEDFFLAFRNNNNNIRDTWVAKSDNDGQSFDAATDVDDTDWLIQFCPASGPDATPFGDSLLIAFYSGANDSRVYFSTLSTETMTLGYQQQLSTFSGDPTSQNYPRTASMGDTLGLVWQENVSGSQDVVLAYSVSGTADLNQQMVKIGEGDLSQRHPDIAAAGQIFHIVYEDLLTGTVRYRAASFWPLTNANDVELETPWLQVSPNPFVDNISLEWDESLTGQKYIRLFNANGQLVWDGRTQDSSFTFQTSNLQSGIYIIEVATLDQTIIRKVIKQK